MAHDTSGESGTPECDAWYAAHQQTLDTPGDAAYAREFGDFARSLELRLTAARAEAEALRGDAARELYEVRSMLMVENALRVGKSPFVCGEKECPYYTKLCVKECGCFQEQTTTHDADIDAALTASEKRDG